MGTSKHAEVTGEPIPYREFRTGLTYRAVYQMLWVHDDDSSRWRYKRRATVLGFWHQLKLQLYEQYLDQNGF